MRQLDGKFSLDGETVVSTATGKAIDLEKEPVILFRARDYLALPTLEHYRQLCTEDGCTDYHMRGLDEKIADFQKFALEYSGMLKQPGVTKGL